MPAGSRGAPGALTQEVAAILNTAIIRQHRTQIDVAEKTGISQSQLSKILRGEKHIDVDLLQCLCDALGLHVLRVIREAETVAAARRAAQRSPIAVAEDLREKLDRKARPSSDGVSDERPDSA